MPFQGMAAYDIASQVTLAAVKAKTDLIGASVALEAGGLLAATKTKTDLIESGYLNRRLLGRRGKAVAGTWARTAEAICTVFHSDVNTDTAGHWVCISGALNDEYSYPGMFLPPGTYSLEIYYYRNINRPIITFRHGATALGTVDEYGAAQENTVATISFVVAADTKADLRLVAESKNGASNGYYMSIQQLTLWRSS